MQNSAGTISPISASELDPQEIERQRVHALRTFLEEAKLNNWVEVPFNLTNIRPLLTKHMILIREQLTGKTTPEQDAWIDSITRRGNSFHVDEAETPGIERLIIEGNDPTECALYYDADPRRRQLVLSLRNDVGKTDDNGTPLPHSRQKLFITGEIATRIALLGEQEEESES